MGRIWCEPSGWEINFRVTRRGDLGGYYTPEVPPGDEDRAERITYAVSLDLFNGKEIPVGLQRVDIVAQKQRRGLFEPKTFRKTFACRPAFPDPWRRQTS